LTFGGFFVERPIDVLNNAKGKRVLIKLKKGTEISGILQAMDLHLNMWLEQAEQISDDKKTKLGTLLVRGDNIIYVSPEKGDKGE
jgi:small nuclear ribonucleoprotein